MTPEAVTLPMLLESRDRRRMRQQEWLKTAPSATLVVLTIVMPGSVKRSDMSLKVAAAAVKALEDTFAGCIMRMETFDLATGFEAFMLLGDSSESVKRKTCGIEDNHPLGRLFDIDVFSPEGMPMSRTEFGLESRKCLMCGNDARVCMRTGAHSYDDLLARISLMISSYHA